MGPLSDLLVVDLAPSPRRTARHHGKVRNIPEMYQWDRPPARVC